MHAQRTSIDVRITEGPVQPLDLQPFPEGAGAECLFLGRSRRDAHDTFGPLVRLSYSAYRPLAERILQELAADAARRFGCRAVRVHHAVGEVPVGAASVLVQVACAHRGEAFEACRFIIDRLKVEAPIWKREQWAEGETWSPGAAAPGAPRRQA